MGSSAAVKSKYKVATGTASDCTEKYNANASHLRIILVLLTISQSLKNI